MVRKGITEKMEFDKTSKQQTNKNIQRREESKPCSYAVGEHSGKKEQPV